MFFKGEYIKKAVGGDANSSREDLPKSLIYRKKKFFSKKDLFAILKIPHLYDSSFSFIKHIYLL
jgi:hypothetical protein